MEYERIKKRMFFEGVEIASFSAIYPVTDRQRINAFYEEVAGRALEWFETKLFESEKEKYAADTDPQKRFSHIAMRYSLRFDAVYLEGDILAVKNFAVLKKGEREEICRFCDCQIWRLSEELMIRPCEAIRLFVGKPFRKRKIGSCVICPQSDGVYRLVGSEWTKIE